MLNREGDLWDEGKNTSNDHSRNKVAQHHHYSRIFPASGWEVQHQSLALAVTLFWLMVADLSSSDFGNTSHSGYYGVGWMLPWQWHSAPTASFSINTLSERNTSTTKPRATGLTRCQRSLAEKIMKQTPKWSWKSDDWGAGRTLTCDSSCQLHTCFYLNTDTCSHKHEYRLLLQKWPSSLRSLKTQDAYSCPLVPDPSVKIGQASLSLALAHVLPRAGLQLRTGYFNFRLAPDANTSRSPVTNLTVTRLWLRFLTHSYKSPVWWKQGPDGLMLHNLRLWSAVSLVTPNASGLQWPREKQSSLINGSDRWLELLIGKSHQQPQRTPDPRHDNIKKWSNSSSLTRWKIHYSVIIYLFKHRLVVVVFLPCNESQWRLVFGSSSSSFLKIFFTEGRKSYRFGATWGRANMTECSFLDWPST